MVQRQGRGYCRWTGMTWQNLRHYLVPRISRWCLAGTMLVLGQAGCKVGPNYKTPPTAIAPAQNWIDYRDPRVDEAQHDLSHWWGVFNDPVLSGLIGQAYQKNLSLRAAGERIVEARARQGIAVGNLFPQQQNVAGAYSFNK